MEIPLLTDIVIIFIISVGVIYFFHRLRVPVIVGFLLTGIVAGPHGLKLVNALHEVEILAEIGVVLLLFTIGIEFSLRSLLRIKKYVLLGGFLQVILTCGGAFAVTYLLDFTVPQAVFAGFLIALSSTAIVLKTIQERSEINSPQGRVQLAILIFQDIVIVPMILLTPIIAGQGGNIAADLSILMLKILLVLGLVFVGGKWIVPFVLHHIARTRSRELFLIGIIGLCFAVAWLTSSLGLSLALGAFLAGLIISESEYSHHAFGNVIPFKDLFTSFFFVSIGMLLDFGFFLQKPVLIIIAALSVITLKTLVAGFVAFALGLPFRITVLVGLGLSQVGEFSFILSKYGVDAGLLEGQIYQVFLAVSVLTMAVTPFIIALSPGFAKLLLKLPIPGKMRRGFDPLPEIRETHLQDHLIIVGFGLNGRNLARAARISGIEYIIMDTNPETVRIEKASGQPIFYGDATQETALRHARIETAKVLVIAIPDPAASERITELARRIAPQLHIIVRTRFLSEVEPLYGLGANEVIPEEFETSVEIFARVLSHYLTPRDQIEKLTAEIRSDGYNMFRSLAVETPTSTELKVHTPDLEITVLKACPGSKSVGSTPAKLGLINNEKVALLALLREEKIVKTQLENITFKEGDLLYILGQPSEIAEIAGLCRTE